jgi:hypothetical protein
MTAKGRVLCALAILVASGCGPHFPRPFQADDMVRIGTGAALADYLTQENASPEVCDRQSRGPHMGALGKEDLGSLTGGLMDGTIPPSTWAACAHALLKAPPSEESALFFDAMGRAYEKLLRKADIEQKPELQARLAALHDLYLFRPAGHEPHAPLMGELVQHLEAGRASGKLGPFAAARAEDLLLTVDLGHDRWKGAPVTTATLDGLAAGKDEGLLRRFALRLASRDLQTEARRRIIRIHIAASTWPEVTAHAGEVEAKVLATGRNAVDVAAHAPLPSASLDRAVLPVHGLLVRQKYDAQISTLLAEEGAGGQGKLMPALPMRGALHLPLAQLSLPPTLCAPEEELDVTPCVLASDVHVKTPFVDLDDHGDLHFLEHAKTADILKEIYDKPSVSWPVEVGHTKVLAFDWPVTLEKPDDVVMMGAPKAPNTMVTVEEHAGRLFFQVDIGKGPLLVAVEKPDTARFAIITRGAQGTAGSPGAAGSNGSPGSSGSSGSCPGSPGGNGGNGTAGGNGGPGGPGGRGADGGDVLVKVACSGADCQRLGQLVAHVVKSEGGAGGPGGPGGPGGQGGAGGSGGSGASCTDSQGHSTSVSGGSSGSAGPNGSPGPRGPDGPPGSPGRVTFGTLTR